MNNSRRRFLKTLGIGAASMPILSNAYGQLPKNESGEKLGIALVGLGNYAENRIGVGLEQSEFWEVKGIVTGTASKIPKWKAKWGIEDKNIFNYENFDAIKDAEDIDVVYIVLPNSMHAEYTIRAAKAGKHVICEKPMATSVKEAEEMIAACEENGVKLAIGYRCHFEPFNMKAIEYGKNKTFGDWSFMSTQFGFRIGDPSQWRLDGKLSGGGPLMDVGIYCVQAARYVSQEEPVSVTAQFGPITNLEKFAEVEESLHWQLDFPSGLSVSGFTSYNTNIERFYATGSKGWIEMSPAWSYGPLKGRTSLGPMTEKVVQHQHYQMEAMGPLFMSADPIPDHASGYEGLRDMKILMAIYDSAHRGGAKVML